MQVPSARRNLRLLWAAQFLNSAALMMLVPLMPFYVERLGVRETGAVAAWAGVALAAPALMLTLTTPLWGRLGDRIGRKWMVVRALAGLALSMVMMALAQTPLALIAGRLLQGAVGGVVEAAAAFVAGESADAELGRSLGRSYTAMASGAVVGPVAGGLLIAGDGLHALMIATAVLATLCALVCAIWLSGRPRPSADQAADSEPGPSSAGRFRGPGVAALLLAAFGIHLAIYGLVPVFALQVRDQLADVADAGVWVGVLHALTWGAAVPGALWWGKRNDQRAAPARSLALGATGCALVLVVQAAPLAPHWLIPIRLIQGFCFAGLAQSVFTQIASRAASSQRSSHVGLANSFILAGQVAGPLCVAIALTALSPGVTILFLGICAAVAALLADHAAKAMPGVRRRSRPHTPPGSSRERVRMPRDLRAVPPDHVSR